MSAKKSRAWSWTYHQPTDQDQTAIENIDCVYLCYGVEGGSQGTTPHLQGYVYFHNARSFAGVKGLFPSPTVHLEASQGNARQNKEYCQKEKGKFFEKGVLPQHGKRNDLHDFIDHVDAGNINRKKLRREFPMVMARYPKFADDIIRDNDPVDKPQYCLSDYPWTPVTDWSKTVLFHGQGRIGKTEFAKAHFPGGYLEVNRMDQLRNYDPEKHEGIVFDDADAAIQKLERSEKLALIEQEGRKAIPGRNVDAMLPPHTKKIITTNIDPKLLFDLEDVSFSDRLRVIGLYQFRNFKK